MLAGEEERNDGQQAGGERLGGVEGAESGMEMQMSVSQEGEKEDIMAEEEMQPQRKMKGHVKWFNCTKGYGFITVDGTEDEVFVHQSNIETDGFRSLREDEPVEFDLVIGDDGKKKAYHVTGPGGAPPLGYQSPAQAPNAPMGMFGGMSPEAGFVPSRGPSSFQGQSPLGPMAGQQMGSQGYYGASGPIPPEAFMGYYLPPGGPYQGFPPQMVPPRGRGGFYPGGQNWAGARPPPPGQPGFSSGLQVVVHNLPWDCTWQELKNAFADCGEIERADVVFDSQGRSRGFGIVRFPDRKSAELAVERMNNKTIGGRIVSVRVDRFA